jgi:flavodoxin
MNAVWTASTNTKYIVKHIREKVNQEIDETDSSLVEIEELT